MPLLKHLVECFREGGDRALDVLYFVEPEEPEGVGDEGPRGASRRRAGRGSRSFRLLSPLPPARSPGQEDLDQSIPGNTGILSGP